MEPINKKEIYTAHKNFVIQFVLLLIFMLFGVFLYIRAADKEYSILREKHEEVENLMASRIEINQQFKNINQRFKELNQFSLNLSDQGKKRILQNDIEKSMGSIQQILSKMEVKEERPSLELYKKLNKDVVLISRLQDSLYSSKNLIESQRLQLKACLDQNSRANEDLSRRRVIR